MKVGFIGLGMMGSGMARNLIKAGHTLIVFNRTRSRAQELAQLGATVAATPGEAAGNAEVLITMLADDHALEDAILGPGRALQSLPAGAIHVGMSTISVAMSRRLQAAHRERQQHYVAAPVFGRPEAAEAAKLFIVVAGPAAQIQRCQVLFDAMGQKTFVLDENAPAANVVKLIGLQSPAFPSRGPGWRRQHKFWRCSFNLNRRLAEAPGTASQRITFCIPSAPLECFQLIQRAGPVRT